MALNKTLYTNCTMKYMYVYMSSTLIQGSNGKYLIAMFLRYNTTLGFNKKLLFFFFTNKHDIINNIRLTTNTLFLHGLS